VATGDAPVNSVRAVDGIEEAGARVGSRLVPVASATFQGCFGPFGAHVTGVESPVGAGLLYIDQKRLIYPYSLQIPSKLLAR